jgi:hypothetical protein
VNISSFLYQLFSTFSESVSLLNIITVLSQKTRLVLFGTKDVVCVRIRQPRNKVDQRPHDTQGRTGSHDLITTWPPILNFTLFHTSNPPGPVPSNWPCHSVYIASIFLCIIILDWALLGEVLPNRSWKIQCCNFYFYISSSISIFLLENRGGTLESPHLVTVKRGPRLRDWERSTNIRNTIHPPCPSGRRLRSTALKDRETGLSANLALTVLKHCWKTTC